MEMCGAQEGEPWRLPDVLRRLPFKSYATKKRAFRVMAEAAQLLLEGRVEDAKGMIAQGLRWLAFSLLVGDRQQADAFRLTFLADPVADLVADPVKTR